MSKKNHDNFCSICEAELSPAEFDICDECRVDLGATEEDKYNRPSNRPEDGDWR